MSGWTPRHSVLLSQILDDVIGTQEAVEIRKDYCKLLDRVISADSGYTEHLTGSKAEGLELPGSDEDYMYDMKVRYKIKVIEQEHVLPKSFRRRGYLLAMLTDNVHPAFAMLRFNGAAFIDEIIFNSLQTFDGSPFLSSYLIVHNHMSLCNNSRAINGTFKRCRHCAFYSLWLLAA